MDPFGQRVTTQPRLCLDLGYVEGFVERKNRQKFGCVGIFSAFFFF